MAGTSTRARRRSALAATFALAAGTLGAVNAVPASGLQTGNGVRPGSNITVFHNIDFVAVFGYGPIGRQVTVRVLRNGVVIGSASGPAIDAEGSPGLEVNHGPEGAPRPGDCWDGHTPDIRPGDVIRVTDSRGTDQVTVDNIAFTGAPSEEAGGDIVVPFTAIDAAGAPIARDRIDSAEFRATSRLRFEATDIVVEAAASGVPGEYVMRYNAPFTPSRNRDLLDQDQLRTLLLGDGHAIGFGHTDPLPRESMLHDGLEDTPGPAPGCEAAPTASAGVTSVTPGVINQSTPATATLRVGGMSQDATEVEVRLRDSNSTVVAPATLSAASGPQTWRASFTAAQLTPLTGNVRVTALIDGVANAVTKTVVRDTVAPRVPRASLPSGLYRRAQRVTLNAGPGERIRYTLGDGSQAAPTLNRGRLYRGEQIRIVRTRTLKAIAIDQAGNRSTVARFRYRIR
jgi:hypothetical protein